MLIFNVIVIEQIKSIMDYFLECFFLHDATCSRALDDLKINIVKVLKLS